MFNVTINPQPISINLDMAQVEKYDESTGELTLFNIETKTVTENVLDAEFTTEKQYDKKYVLTGFLNDPKMVQALVDLANGTMADLTLEGEVLSNTDAKLIANITSFMTGEGAAL